MITTKNKKQYFNLKSRKFISWNFYKGYINVEPPFGTLGAVTFLRTYSRFIPELKRREKWCETVLRSVEYNIGLDTVTPRDELVDEAKKLFDDLFNLRTFLSGRSYWVGGTPVVEADGSAIFNCTFRQVTDISAFAEIYRWLLIGAGAGFSVETKCINKLPLFKNKLNIVHKDYVHDLNRDKYTTLNDVVFDIDDLQVNDREFKGKVREALKEVNYNQVNIVVGDSKDGWVAALRLLLTLYTFSFPATIPPVNIDYDYIRPAGERLHTFGGRASGYGALRITIEKIQRCIETRSVNGRLDSVAITDIICFIAEGVIAGGTRRSSLISLGDADDMEFVNMKKDLFYDESLKEFRKTRTNSNNSVMIYEKPTREYLTQLMEPIKTNGDPGVYFIGNLQKKRPVGKGTNPCFRGDTLILTRNGNFPIKDLVGKEVEIWDGEQWRMIDNFRVTGKNQDVYTITLHNGQQITATPYHTFILENGERKQLKDLAEGEVLMQHDQTVHGSHDESGAYLKGFAKQVDIDSTLRLGRQLDFERLVNFRDKDAVRDNSRPFSKIRSIEFAGVEDEVYCCTVPGNHTFALSAHILVGNCGELLLDSQQCCNLTSINVDAFIKLNDAGYYLDFDAFKECYARIVRGGSRMTLVDQWHKDWDRIQKRDRLLGQAMTGLMDALIKIGAENDLEYQAHIYEELRVLARDTADAYHDHLGVPRSASITTFKPSGSLTQLPTVSSGIHMPYAPQYQRAIRFSRRDPMAEAMKNIGMTPVPENQQGDDLYGEECDTWIFKFAVKTEAKIRQIDEPATLQLNRYKAAMDNYIESHNVSITVNVDEHEWDDVVDWFDENSESIGGIALLNKFDPNKVSHPNLPYQPVDQEAYESLEKDTVFIKEEDLIAEIAKYEIEEEEYDLKEDGCASGACPVR